MPRNMLARLGLGLTLIACGRGAGTAETDSTGTPPEASGLAPNGGLTLDSGAAGVSGGRAGTGVGTFGGESAAGTAFVPGTSACAIADPFLKASGMALRNGRGTADVIALRGANLGGALVAEPYMSPISDMKDDYTLHQVLEQRFGPAVKTTLLRTFHEAWIQAADFENLAAMGMNAVRLPISYLHMQEPDGSLRPDAFERLDFVVSEAWKHCIYTVIDLHHAWGSASTWASGGRIGPAELFSNEQNQQNTERLWATIAEHYRGNPAVAGYDVINEPAGNDSTTNEQRWALQDRMYRAIRSQDPDHSLFVEAIWLMSDLPRPERFGWSNVVYECHHYLWDHATDLAAQKAGADDKAHDVAKYSYYGVPIFLGEFNFFGLPEAWRYGMEQWDKAGLSWTMWSARAAVDGADQNNGWGLFNPRSPRPDEPNLARDSSADIARKWSSWTAQAFAPNPDLRTALAMPRVVADAYDSKPETPLSVPAPGVLRNDTHLLPERASSLTVQLVSSTRHGQVSLETNGAFSYTPEAGFIGTDQFSYSAFDGRLHAPAPGVVRIAVHE